jgi:hypothetical protein
MNEESIAKIKRDIVFTEGLNLPTLCISLFDNQVIFTTKKIGSRYFEDITKLNEGTDNPITIEFKILRYTDNQKSDPNFDSRLIFDNYYFEVANESHLTIDSFFSKLKIKKISDIVSDDLKMQLITIVREPIKRTLTAFIETCDAYFLNAMKHPFSRDIFQKYFQILITPSASYGFHQLPTESVNKILNEYALTTGPDLIKDEHANGWHMFLYKFVKKYELESRIKVVDLDNKEDMSMFPRITQPSNKQYLNNWLDTGNKFNVDTLITSIQSFLVHEIDAYNELLELKHKWTNREKY